MPHPGIHIRHSVARQFMLRLAAAGSLFALITTLIAVIFEYRRDSMQIEAILGQIEEGYLGSVTETVWLEDRDRLALLAMGIARLPHVVRVEVRDPANVMLSAAGETVDENRIERSFSLVKQYKGKPLTIGSLYVSATLRKIRADALTRMWIIGATSLSLVAAASVFIFLMARTLIASPLGRLAAYARSLGHSPSAESTLPDLGASHADNEFSDLLHAFSDMQRRISATLQDLTASENRYRDLFASSPISLWEEDFSAVKRRLLELQLETDDLDLHLVKHPELVAECASLVRVIDVNGATLRMHNAKSKEALLAGLQLIFTDSSLHGFRTGLVALMRGQTEQTFESEVRTLNGEVRDVVIHWLVPPANRENLDRVIVSQEDITESVQVRHSLSVTVERLMDANSELERFAHAAAHDLLEPVRSIVSFSQLLERHLRDSYDKEIKEYLAFLVAAARRMQTQVQGLQDYARIGEGAANREAVDLGLLAGKAVALLKESVRRTQAEITVNPLPRVFVNAEQITDVLRNLLDNAIKFQRPGVPPEIVIDAEPREGEWLISVKDNGIGIDPRYASDVFQVFRRLNPPSHVTGEGIGLSLCKRVIERHGGRIWLESSLGEGSIFHFTLPASEEKSV
ncbi:MAG: HAMP domain-containing protein [Rhodospirillales bacterium]|nr:MAG: HAMP domain-containing protein [Rhodospirillales bacterium]